MGVRRWALIATFVVAALVGLLAWRDRSRERDSRMTSPSAAASEPHRPAPAYETPAIPATIEGTVRDATGRAVEAAWVTLQDDEHRSDRAAASVATLADGSFSFVDVQPGKFRLAATARGLRPAHGEPLVVGAGEVLRGVELRLGPPGVALSGHVLDSGGGPISHATLTLNQDGLIETLTDSAGAYSLNLDPQSYSVTVRATGYADHMKLVSLVADTTLDFLLHPGAIVRGHVMLGDAPVAGASVRVSESDTWLASPMDATAGQDGAFEVRGLNPGSYTVVARSGTDVSAPVTISVNVDGDTDVTLMLEKGAVMSGRVLAPDGAPIAGAHIDVRQDWRNTWQSTSDERGAFRVEGLLQGTLRVAVHATGFADIETQVEAGPRAIIRDYQLRRGDTIDGVLLGLDDRPLPATEVTAHATAHYRNHPEAKTDSQGRFSLLGLAPDEYALSAKGNGGFATATVVLVAGKHPSVTLKLEPGAEIRGRVTQDGGSPAAGALVVATDPHYSTTEVSAGTDGSYVLRNVPGGRFTVTASGATIVPRGWWGRTEPSASSRSIALVLAPGETRANVDFIVPKAPAPIRGVVVEADGAPAARVRVSAGESNCSMAAFMGGGGTETDSDGAFVIDGADGPIDVCAHPPLLPPAVLHGVKAGTTGLRIVLERGTTIGGTVSRRDGKPLGYCHVEAVSSSDSRLRAPSTTADASGAFEFRGMATGTYTLRARTQDGMFGETPGVVVATRESSGLRIVLNEGASIRGRVIDESGAGMREALVEADRASTTTGPDGTFVLSGLRGGVTHLYVHPPDGGMFDSRDVTLRDGSQADMGVLRIVDRAFPRPTGLVGLNPERVGDRLLVTKVHAGYPAAKAGVKEGDEIVTIDSFVAKELGDISAPSLIRGAPGTTVTLGIARGQGPAQPLTLTRVAALADD